MPLERMIRITEDEWNNPRIQDWLRLTPWALLRKTWNLTYLNHMHAGSPTLKKFEELELAPVECSPLLKCVTCTHNIGKRLWIAEECRGCSSPGWRGYHAKATSETENNG